jgi:hypothetical protein
MWSEKRNKWTHSSHGAGQGTPSAQRYCSSTYDAVPHCYVVQNHLTVQEAREQKKIGEKTMRGENVGYSLGALALLCPTQKKNGEKSFACRGVSGKFMSNLNSGDDFVHFV